jgi:hypothetical protein
VNFSHIPKFEILGRDIGGDRGRDVSDDMVGELIHAEDVEKESLLPIIVWWKSHEDDQNEGLDAEDEDNLQMNGSDGGLCLSISRWDQGIIGLGLRRVLGDVG